jgi:hypothetical protein
MLTNEIKTQLWELFKSLGVHGLTMNHYDLAKSTNITDPDKWKQFLLEQDVRNYIQTEVEILRTTEFNKMIKNVGDNQRSVGQAQLMSALDKIKQDSNHKEGPVFIYTYVPLSSEQAQAENVQEAESDPFWRRG